jgi:DNA-binding IclR family transcriptional regulator
VPRDRTEEEQTADDEGGALRGAQTVYRAISILETFKADHAVLTLAEICEAVELTPPTAHRLLRALRSHDLISFDERARTYSLGAGVMRLASVLLNRDDVLSIVGPRLHRLRDLTNETVALHWRVEDHRVCLMENVSTQQIRMASGLGKAYPLVAGAAGKAILAYVPEEDVERTIEMERRNGRKLSAAALKAELQETRRRGYAQSVGETVSSAAAVAAPILNSAGRAIGALNVTGPADRVDDIFVAKTVPLLLSATHEVMEQLGYDRSALAELEQR